MGEFREGEGIEVGDWVRIRKTMHTYRTNRVEKYEMTREGRILEIKGIKNQIAVVRVNMKQLASGDWVTSEIPFSLRVITVLAKSDQCV